MNTQDGIVQYFIDNQKYSFHTYDNSSFSLGKNEILSNVKNDITYTQPWYEKGYEEIQFLDNIEFEFLKEGVRNSIAKIISEEISISNIDGFNLENYHHYVLDDKAHLKVVTRSRDLFEEDFHFPVFKYLSRFEEILNMKLTNVFKIKNIKMHVIIRINRPHSNDFNPPHKDMYEGYDMLGYPPHFMNFWIPIAGVTENSSLPLASSSHLVNENIILRTFHGGLIEGNLYRVRMIKSWNQQNSLTRSNVKYGQVLMFSSHLIHGLAINNELDLTRVALEFRLFRDEKPLF